MCEWDYHLQRAGYLGRQEVEGRPRQYNVH